MRNVEIILQGTDPNLDFYCADIKNLSSHVVLGIAPADRQNCRNLFLWHTRCCLKRLRLVFEFVVQFHIQFNVLVFRCLGDCRVGIGWWSCQNRFRRLYLVFGEKIQCFTRCRIWWKVIDVLRPIYHRWLDVSCLNFCGTWTVVRMFQPKRSLFIAYELTEIAGGATLSVPEDF